MKIKTKSAPLLLHSIAWFEHGTRAGRMFQHLPDGWEPYACDRCGIPCVLSPSSKQYLVPGGNPRCDVVLCYDCAGPIITKAFIENRPPVVHGTQTAIDIIKHGR